MLWIVLPFVTSIADAGTAADVGAISATEVGIAVEIIVYVDINVVMSPPTAPAPAAAPRSSHCHTDTKGDGASGDHCPGRVGRVVNRGIRIRRRSINDCRIIAWHINHLRVCLFHHNY